jgi:hypothetical protein
MNTPTMTNLLRKAIKDAPSVLSISEATGVTRQSIMAFMKGTSLRLDIAEKLAAHFGIECRFKKGR